MARRGTGGRVEHMRLTGTGTSVVTTAHVTGQVKQAPAKSRGKSKRLLPSSNARRDAFERVPTPPSIHVSDP